MVTDTTNIVIGGSGPSLTCIDYSRLPQRFDTFRLNNFFFEPKYYLGKNVTYYLTNYGFLRNQFFNLWNLQERKEYSIGTIFSTGNLEAYPTVTSLEAVVSQEKKFLEFMFFYQSYYGFSINGGIFSLFGAIAMGYKNIYLTGIDFYQGVKDMYPWDLGEKYCDANPRDDTKEKALNVINHYHPESVQIKALLLAKDILLSRGGNIYSISMNSKINDYIEMGPIRNESEMRIEDKEKDAILDWLELPQIKSFVQKTDSNEDDKNRYALCKKPCPIEVCRVRLLKHITLGRVKQHYTEKYKKYKKIIYYSKRDNNLL